GANMVRRLLKNGKECVVFDRSPDSVKHLVKEGAIGAISLADLVTKLGLNQLLRGVNLAWHGVKPNQPDWSEASHSIAFTVEIQERVLFHVILNAYWQSLDFELPRLDSVRENR